MTFCTSAVLLAVLSTPPGHDLLWLGDAGRLGTAWKSAPDCFDAVPYGSATDETHDVWRHPAPEVVLWFSGGCNAAEFTNWKLSSHDAPHSWTVIPLGSIRVEVNIDITPIDFVELLLDGKPLAPKDYLNSSPLNYELPCPAPGQHVLQARYLHNHRWSELSPALQIEVRRPSAPRILAISDSHQDPIVLTRNGVASITTGDVKIRLANVDRMTHIVTYIDDKPVAASQAEDSCCRIVRVEGFVTPGVHRLTARAVSCPGTCSITSPPSNEVTFHYYDEDVYLLRPNAVCGNHRQDASFHVLPSAAHAAETQRANHRDFVPPGHTSVLGRGTRTFAVTEFRTATFLAQPDSDRSITTLIAFTQATAASEAESTAETAKLKAIVETTASLLQPAEQAVSQARDSALAASNIAQQADTAASSVRPDSDRTKEIAEIMGKLNGEAQSKLEVARTSLAKATRDVDQAMEYSSREANSGDTARARVAKRFAVNAARNRDALQAQVTELDTSVSRMASATRESQGAAERTKALHSSAMNYAALSKQQAEAAVVRRDEAFKAQQSLTTAHARAKAAQQSGDLPTVRDAGNEAAIAYQIVEARSKAAKAHGELADNYADLARQQASAVNAIQEMWEVQLSQSSSIVQQMSQTLIEVKNKAIAAENNRGNAGRTVEKEAEGERQWDASEEQAALAAAEARLKAAEAGNDENGVRRAHESARAAQTIAADEWKNADSRMAEAEAKTSFARAQQVTNPPSPFYFASAAHFPLRDFGLKGQPIDRDGLIIYEDMAFLFDRHGNYEMHFRATTPEMPTTLRLQFQIQPHRGGPWYTITLAPIDFKYPVPKVAEKACATGSCDNANDSKQCCGKVRECICKGHSEILRRCYGEMGQDARIRREGSTVWVWGQCAIVGLKNSRSYFSFLSCDGM